MSKLPVPRYLPDEIPPAVGFQPSAVEFLIVGGHNEDGSVWLAADNNITQIELEAKYDESGWWDILDRAELRHIEFRAITRTWAMSTGESFVSALKVITDHWTKT